MAKETQHTGHQRLRLQITRSEEHAGLDDMLCEQIKHLGPKATVWLNEMMKNILVSKKLPKLRRKSKMIAILKPGKDSSLPKGYRPISLLCHTYKLLERIILNPIKESTPVLKSKQDLDRACQIVCPGQPP